MRSCCANRLQARGRGHISVEYRTPEGSQMRRVVTCVLATALLLTAATTVAMTSSPQILPGVAVGPVRLGMTAAQGRAAAAAFRDATGCEIDIHILSGRVDAAGSRYGGCLELAMPAGPVMFIQVGSQMIPLASGIGGSPAPLVQAFGKPATFPLTREIAALLWKNGLVAQVALGDQVAIVTYLAIVPAGTRTPPYPLLYPRGSDEPTSHRLVLKGAL